MAHRDYLIRYSNGFKRHVSREERDILIDSLQPIGPREYLSRANLQVSLEEANGPSFLFGKFIFELRGKKRVELMQSPQGLVRQLERQVIT
jgi:hypothetical protein